MLSLFVLTLLFVPALSAQVLPAPTTPGTSTTSGTSGAPRPSGPSGPSGNDQRWKTEQDAGLKAIEQGLYSQAVRSFQVAIGEAEKFGPTDPRLAQSLTGIAQAYLQQGNFAAAERQFQQALAIYDKTAEPNNLNVPMVLNGLVTLHRLRENYAEATMFSRRSLAILEKAYGTEHVNVAIGQNNLAMILRLHGNYDEARVLSERSLAILEKALGPEHVNSAISLNNLVSIHVLQGNYAAAEVLARRSVSIFEKTPDAGTSNLLQSLENLAQVCREIGKYDESEQLYRRVLSLRWGVAGDVVPILDRFADMLNLAFTEMPLKEAQEAFRVTPGWNGISADLYILMGKALRDRGLAKEPEDVLLRAIQAFPNSLEARYELAQGYAETRRWQTALDTLESTAKIRGSGDPVRDRYIRSRIYEEISRMQVYLSRFNEALANLQTALDLDPGNARAVVDLGDLYLKLERPEDAAKQYAQAILLTGGNATAYYGLAEVSRLLGHYPQAVMAADRALELNPRDAKSSLIRANALHRSGRSEEGDAELQRFGKLEASERDEGVRGRTIPVTLRTAFAKLEEGQGEAAIEVLREGTRAYPDSASLQLNLGITQSRLGMHQDALKTFQAMVDQGFQDQHFFLVHLNLSREYEVLGDMKASRLHRLIYLQKYDAFLNKRR